MASNFNVAHLSVERLIRDWRWLCNERVSLIARNIFGDLFLVDDDDRVWKLDVGSGQLIQVAESADQFRALAETRAKKVEWFAADLQQEFSAKGLNPGGEECVAFKIPVVFRESAGVPNNAYVGNLYEYVSHLGSVHRQIAGAPDGTKVKLRLGKEPGRM